MTHTDFIKAFLAVHDIADKYSPGVASGPDFKMSYTGSVGGKTGAPTIQKDEDFKIVISGLLLKDKVKQSLSQVAVKFDIDQMEGFCIKHVIPEIQKDTSTDGELLYGTR
ncbi:hypothetical protein H0H81_001715, partial [Sphagnurus paluster]